jgi:dihydrofolate reductase (trimethoprim resistance protein)
VVADNPKGEVMETGFTMGSLVQKKRGSKWRGKVVGFYSTDHTERGYSVESLFEQGSVQVWPEAALEPWDGELPSIEPGTGRDSCTNESGLPDQNLTTGARA